MVLTMLPYPKFRHFISSVPVLGYIAFDYAAIAGYAAITWARDQYNCTEFALATLLLSDLSTAFYVLVTYAPSTYDLLRATPEAESSSTQPSKDATANTKAAAEPATATSPTEPGASGRDTTRSGTSGLGSERGMVTPLAQVPMTVKLVKYIRHLTIFFATVGALMSVVAIAGCRSSCHSIELKSFTSTLCAAIGLAKLGVLTILVTSEALPTWLKTRRDRLPDSTFPPTFRGLWFVGLLTTIIMVECWSGRGLDLDVNGVITPMALAKNAGIYGQTMPIIFMVQSVIMLFSEDWDRGEISEVESK